MSEAGVVVYQGYPPEVIGFVEAGVEKQHPTRWYDVSRFPYLVGWVSLIAGWLLWLRVRGNWWLSGLGMVFYLASAVWDIYTTLKFVSINGELEKMGMAKLAEANPILPESPTLKDMISGKHLVFQVLALLANAIYWWIGFGVGAAKIAAGFGNLRLYRREALAVKLLKRKMGKWEKRHC